MISRRKVAAFAALLLVIAFSGVTNAQEDVLESEAAGINLDADFGAAREGSRTDDEALQREEEAIKLDGLSVKQMKEIRERADKYAFQAEVSRMMKLIINSLYRNKEIFLRELISNASDALDKIRVISLTEKSALETNKDLEIRIKADKDSHMLHISDTGVGMSKDELVKNLGTIAKSGTAEFLSKVGEASELQNLNDLIGQFGVGFYSAFLVADRVIVTSKSNDDPVQHIWESDSAQFSVVDDPRGDSLKRGTQVSLVLKEEARDFLEVDTLRNLIRKYSQFINFPIYLWSSKTEIVEEPVEEEPEKKDEAAEKKDEDEEAQVEEAKEEEKPKTKKVEKTVWDWELINTAKPIWQRKPEEISDDEYNEFYRSLTKDNQEPLTRIHFTAEGEVTFKSLLYVPKVQPTDSFNRYGTRVDNIKLYVRRVFITDDFQEMMPNYLSFIRGVVDSDDLPLNVSRETLQQHKLLKVIRKKLVRKALDMIKKIPADKYDEFWKEFSTNLKLGIIEDATNRQRLAKLLRFHSSSVAPEKWTSLNDYVKRMAPKQEYIYYIAGASYDEVSRSPFVERLLKKNYEVLYLTDAVDEYAISNLPEFEGKKFANVAKEGLKLDTDEQKAKEKQEALEREFEPLTKWLESKALKSRVTKVKVSHRLHESPAALVASQFGWTGNMERLARSNAHSKTQDATRDYYLNQKKILEINPRHPIVRELLRRVNDDEDDMAARQMSLLMFETATLRSGYMLEDTEDFGRRVERLLRKNLGVDEDAPILEDEDDNADAQQETTKAEGEEIQADEEDEPKKSDEHEEL